MAKDKKSILVYADWINIFEKLEDAEAGVLIKHFFRYVNDLNPDSPDRLTDIVFEPIKQQLKRDLKKYEAICLRNKGNGEKGGRPKQNPDEPRKPSGLIGNPENPDEPDTDNDTDNDIKDNTIKPKNTGLITKYAFIDSLIDEFKKSYESNHNSSYEIIAIGKERKAVAQILKEFKKKRSGATSEETIKELRAYFNLCNKIEDPWLNQNMSLSIIVSKFNEINNILRNGNKRKKNESATSDEQLADTIAKHFATDYKQ